MERIFHLKENGTTVKTEILAGLTTFMTMAYIIALNPNLLTNFAVGTPLWNGVFLATCIASAIGTVTMAFLANKPFVMAPGMGLNSFFAVVAGNVAAMLQTDYTSAFQAVLCIILVEGIVFLLLSVFNIRDKIVDAIPLGVRLGIGPAIGLMLMNIGLGSNVGIYAEGNGYSSPFYVLRDFFGAMTPSVIQGWLMIKLANKATTSIIGINIKVGTFIFLVETVGMRLTIRKATTSIRTLQKVFERRMYSSSGKSKVIIIGIIAKAAAAGAGTPTKK